jgi:hypothetical protein
MRRLLAITVGTYVWSIVAFRSVEDFGVVGVAPVAWWVWSRRLERRNV